MDAIPSAEVYSPAAGSALCLACGFCCDGTLHTCTVLQPDEVAPLGDRGLRAETIEGRPRFRQPCPCFRDGLCTIYPDRPRVCRDYQCALLARRLAADLTGEECAVIVSTARELLEAIRREAPGIMAFRALLKAISELPDSEEAATGSLARLLDTPETLTRVLALATHLHQHFDPVSEDPVAHSAD